MTDTKMLTDLPEDRLLLWPEVSALVRLSRVSIWQLRRAGAFPKPVRLTTNRIAWKRSEIETWIASRQRA